MPQCMCDRYVSWVNPSFPACWPPALESGGPSRPCLPLMNPLLHGKTSCCDQQPQAWGSQLESTGEHAREKHSTITVHKAQRSSNPVLQHQPQPTPHQLKLRAPHLAQGWQVVHTHAAAAARCPCVSGCHGTRQLRQQPLLLVAVAVVAKPGTEACEVLQSRSRGKRGRHQQGQ